MDNSQLPIIVQFDVKPENVNEFLENFTLLVAETRKEPGCLRFELDASLDSPTTFFLVELWKSEADLHLHFETDHVKSLLPKL